MIDVFMLIMTIVLAVLLVVISLWLLIYYGHPDDRWDCFAIFCKIVMVQFIWHIDCRNDFSLGSSFNASLRCFKHKVNWPLTIRGFGGDINMAVFWQIIYISLAVFVVIIIPACTYYYEADDEWSCVINY